MGILEIYKTKFEGKPSDQWSSNQWKIVVSEVIITAGDMLTIEDAANFVGHKYGLNNGTISELRNQMLDAIGNGLTVRSPQTDLPVVPKIKRTWNENVRADELDAWFESQSGQYRILSDVSAPAESKPESEAETESQFAPAILDGEPRLQKGKNTRAKVDAWVKWTAKQKVMPGDTGVKLAERIQLEANKWGYLSDRTKEDEHISLPAIVTMLPVGITGGRGKARGKSKK